MCIQLSLVASVQLTHTRTLGSFTGASSICNETSLSMFEVLIGDGSIRVGSGTAWRHGRHAAANLAVNDLSTGYTF